jgi:hypothetical protein
MPIPFPSKMEPRREAVPLTQLKMDCDTSVPNFFWGTKEDWEHDCQELNAILPAVQVDNHLLLLCTGIHKDPGVWQVKDAEVIFYSFDSRLIVKWFQMRGHLLRLISSVEFQSGSLPQGYIINPNKGLFGLNTDWVSTDIPGLYSEYT